MPSEKDGVMIILSSPSGAGKTTLVKKLSEKDNFEISISHTTRQPRPNENQNEDYYFVDELEFKRLINNDLNECFNKISNLINAVINNGSKDYDLDYIRSHVNKLTS